jgi:hypothetical protein
MAKALATLPGHAGQRISFWMIYNLVSFAHAANVRLFLNLNARFHVKFQ